MRRITFLGTGLGMPLRSSSSCTLLEDKATNLLLDAGGGHDILGKFHAAKVNPTAVKNIFITHYDSDHILGIVPLVRAFSRWAKPQKRNIFCSLEVKNAIDSLFQYISKTHFDIIKPYLNFIIIKDGMNYKLNDWTLTFFDIKSKGTPQMGCTITFPDNTKLAFLGDEPFRESYFKFVKDSDIVMHNAFCLDSQQDIFKPHEKNHSTVKEAAANASKIGAKTLILIHMEDDTLKTRKKKYLQEARENFKGEIVVPVDLDTFEF